MDVQAIKPWLIFQQIPSLSYAQKQELLSVFSQPQTLFEQDGFDFLPEASRLCLQALQQQKDAHELSQQAERTIEKAAHNNVHILCLDDKNYPHLLHEIHQPPLVLYAKGQLEALNLAQIGVVGARKASPLARKTAEQWCQALTQAGIVITSGLALGIDICAHQGALQGGGKTIAVLAHGLDEIYPARHQPFAEQIIEQGALLSEFPFSSPPRKEYFPQRNRLISGLSLAVWVVEAALKSGSLITARYAMEQGRDVLATPGAVNNAMAKGCHSLIKQGAQLVDSCEDILQALALPLSFALELKEEDKQQPISEIAQRVLTAMSGTPTHINELAHESGLPVELLASELIMLELAGKVANHAGYYQKLV